MATSKQTAPKVGTYRGGSKSKTSGRGGFLGKTTSGGNLGRSAMTNSGAVSAARGYGKSGGADAGSFAVGGGAGGTSAGGASAGGASAGGSPGYGGAPGVPSNASGAGVDWSSGDLIEGIVNPGGAPAPAGGYAGQPTSTASGSMGQDYPGVTYQYDEAPAVESGSQIGDWNPIDNSPIPDTFATSPTRAPVTSAPSVVKTVTPTASPIKAPVAAPTVAAPKVGTTAPNTMGISTVTSPTGVTRSVSSGATPTPVSKPALYETNPTPVKAPTPAPAPAPAIKAPVSAANLKPIKL